MRVLNFFGGDRLIVAMATGPFAAGIIVIVIVIFIAGYVSYRVAKLISYVILLLLLVIASLFSFLFLFAIGLNQRSKANSGYIYSN